MAMDQFGAQLPWWAGVPGSHGTLIGPQPQHVASHRHVAPMRPKHITGKKLHEPGMHGDLSITHGASGAVTITHQPHGEDAGDEASPGAIDTNEPNYGSVEDYDAAAINRGTMQLLTYDDTSEGKYDEMYWDPSMQQPHDQETRAHMAPTGSDVYEPPERVANSRNYAADFGLQDDWYSGFGPAAIIGCDEDLVVAGDIGCANDTKVRG
jgi:hypothetical protein